MPRWLGWGTVTKKHGMDWTTTAMVLVRLLLLFAVAILKRIMGGSGAEIAFAVP